MDNNVAFSFVMPAFKGAFLYKAINSILNQTYQNFELIIINDASPYDITGIVKVFQDSRIRYKVNETNLGGKDLVSNWNHCIKFARNEYIILATDDDMFEPTFLEKASTLIKKYPSIDIIRSGVKKIDEHDILLDHEFPLKEFMTGREFTLYYAKGGTISCISNYIFKKDSLIRNGGFIPFPRAHYSDDATALALAKNGIACIPTNEMSFRVSSINLSNCSDLYIVKEQLKATEQYMSWYLDYIKTLDTSPGDFFERACYGGYKERYIVMIEKLINKIPFYKFYLSLKTILTIKFLFGRERLKLIATSIINKL